MSPLYIYDFELGMFNEGLHLPFGMIAYIAFPSVIIIFILFNINYSSSNEIEVAPLINLDEISPSYDELDENLDDFDLAPEISANNKLESFSKSLASIGILNKVTAQVSTVEILSGKEVLVYDFLA